MAFLLLVYLINVFCICMTVYLSTVDFYVGLGRIIIDNYDRIFKGCALGLEW